MSTIVGNNWNAFVPPLPPFARIQRMKPSSSLLSRRAALTVTIHRSGRCYAASFTAAMIIAGGVQIWTPGTESAAARCVFATYSRIGQQIRCPP